MAMTAAVKDELSRLELTKSCCRRAEVSALLRFAGGVQVVAGRVVVGAELDAGSIARRLRKAIGDLYGYSADVHVLTVGQQRAGSRFVVRVVAAGEALARRTGLLDPRGRPVRGLSASVVAGGVCDSASVWRGAFLAQGSLTEPGRSPALEVVCPGPEAAMALVRAARRLRITAKAREVRGQDRVVVRDGEAIGALLTGIRTVSGRAGRSVGCAGKNTAAPRTGWPTSMTRTCGAPRSPRLPRRHGWTERCRSSATIFRTTWQRPAPCDCTTATPHWRNSVSSLIHR